MCVLQVRSLGRGSSFGSEEESAESLLEGVLTAHSVEAYVLHATLLASLVDMETSQLTSPPGAAAAAAAVGAAGADGDRVRVNTERTSQHSFYSTLATLLHVESDFAAPAAGDTGTGTDAGTAHQALRRHLCSLKGSLFSDAVLAGVTAEWRDLLVRLAAEN